MRKGGLEGGWPLDGHLLEDDFSPRWSGGLRWWCAIYSVVCVVGPKMVKLKIKEC